MTVGVSTLAQALSQVDRIKVLQTKFDTLAERLPVVKDTKIFRLGSDARYRKDHARNFRDPILY